MKLIITLFYLLSFTMLLASCVTVDQSPRYRTSYTYTDPDPKTQAFTLCLADCRSSRNECKEDVDKEKKAKQAEYNRDYRECKKVLKYCTRLTAYSSYATCEYEYNSCYTECGGQVSSERVCYDNCGSIK